MATDVLTLLTFPKTSDGLSALRPTAVDSSLSGGSASPPRKLARLDTDSDASNSRSRSTRRAAGPIQIQLLNNADSVKGSSSNQQMALLRASIRTLLMRFPGVYDTIPATNEGIYSACRALVLGNSGQDLYNIVRIELEQSVGRMSQSLLDADDVPTEWLKRLNAWLNWLEDRIQLVKSLLTYLDQVYAFQNPGAFTVHALAYQLVAENIFGQAAIAERWRNGVRDWLQAERTSGHAHPARQTIASFVQHMHTHKQYSAFEDDYVKATHEFYTRESETLSKDLSESPKEFFQRAIGLLASETERSKEVLPIESWTIVRETAEKGIFSERVQWLSFSILQNYLDAKQYNDVSSMYALFSRIGGTEQVRAAFKEYVRKSVVEIVMDVEQEDDMVPRLLEFRACALEATTQCFVDDPPAANPTAKHDAASTSQLAHKIPNQSFHYALDDAFTEGFKARRIKPAEMIAKYLDKLLKKGQGKTSDADYQAILDTVLALYRYTDDKDVFRAFYHRSLAKRLLLEKTASDDFEKAMLKKLKEQYDAEFGTAEDMFKDLALSRDLNADYHARLPLEHPGRKLNAMVLQRSAWPFTVKKEKVDLPPSMAEQLMKYDAFYKSKHSGRVLDWEHSLGTATLKARFAKGYKELSVSLFQAVVLLLFNDADELSYSEISESVRMEKDELKRTLQSLACGKKRVLTKIPIGKDINDDDVFKFNPDFWDERYKIHINSIQAKVSPEESRKTNESVEEDRKYAIDAAVVRIMKGKKEMTFEQLKFATIDAVKAHFNPQVDIIKKRIDALVEQDYLERDPKDKSRYLYVA